MEINGVINPYPPGRSPSATGAESASNHARSNSNSDVSYAEATAATQDAVASVSSGAEHDVTQGTRKAIVALAAAVGSPAAAQLVAHAAKRMPEIKVQIHHAEPAPQRQPDAKHQAAQETRTRGTSTSLTQRTGSGELANSVSGSDHARQARHTAEHYRATTQTRSPQVSVYA